VGDSNKYVLNVLWSPTALQVGDVYITTYPSYLPVSSASCNINFFDLCIVLPVQNQLYVKVKMVNPTPVSVYISAMPSSISRTTTTFQSQLFRAGRYNRLITHSISASPRWTSLIGAISNYQLVVPSGVVLNSLQKGVDLTLSFQVQHAVPRTGTILVRLPTALSAVYSHCRSATLQGSQLFAEGGTAAKMGDIGCSLQQTSTLIVNGFEPLAAGATVVIAFKVDLPSYSSTNLGTVEIATYADTHATDVYSNGRTIDYYSGNFVLSTFSAKPTWGTLPSEFRIAAEPLRAGVKNPLRLTLRLASEVRGESAGSNGYFSFYLYFSSLTGTNSGGFTAPASTTCRIVAASTKEDIACRVSDAQDVRATSTKYHLLVKIVPY
jgi:hypothetical protein